MTRRALVREGGLVLFGQLAGVTGMLLGIRFVTELLPPAAYGEFSLGLTLAALLTQIGFGPLANAAARFYAPAVEKGSLPAYLAAIWRLSRSVFAIAAVLLVVLCGGALALGFGVTVALLVAGSLVFTSVSGLTAMLGGIQNAARKRAVVAFHQVIDVWLKIGFAVALLLTFGSTSAAAMWGYVLAASAVACSQYIFYRRLVHRQSHAQSDATWRREIWAYAWPFTAWGVFTWAQIASDRWALEWFATRDDVGFLAALAQLGYAPIQLATAIAVQYLAPILYERAGDAADENRNRDVSRMARRLTTIALGVTAVGFAFTFLAHEPLFRWLVSEKYRQVSYLLPWVVLAGGVFAASQTVALELMSQLRARAMLPAKIGTALLGLGLNLLGAHLYGIRGVVAASVTFSTASLVWMLALTRVARART